MCTLYTQLMCTRDQCVYVINFTSDHKFTRPFDVKKRPFLEILEKIVLRILVPINILHKYEKYNYGQIFFSNRSTLFICQNPIRFGYKVWCLNTKIDI